MKRVNMTDKDLDELLDKAFDHGRKFQWRLKLEGSVGALAARQNFDSFKSHVIEANYVGEPQ